MSATISREIAVWRCMKSEMTAKREEIMSGHLRAMANMHAKISAMFDVQLPCVLHPSGRYAGHQNSRGTEVILLWRAG